MTRYEFKCKTCGLTVTRPEPAMESYAHFFQDVLCDGAFKRVYSVGFQIKSTDWGHS